jgi:DinB superfamily
MIRTIAWFEREFRFDLPVWMYANVIERLRGTPARLEDRIGSLPAATLTHREGEQWSIQEHAGHLLDLGPLDLVRLDDYEAGRESLSPADRENRKTHEANHNARAVADILRAFRAERAEFVRRLEQYDEEFAARAAMHLRLKTKMRVVDFAFFIAEHDDHHLARIAELIHTP